MKLSNFLRTKPLLSEPDASMVERSNSPAASIFSNRAFFGENLSDDIPFRLISSLKTLINCVPVQDSARKEPPCSISHLLDVLCSNFGISRCIIAGGVFRSLFDGEVPRDIDVFVAKGIITLSEENIKAFLETTFKDSDICVVDQTRTFSCGFKNDELTDKWNALHKHTIDDPEVTKDFFSPVSVYKKRRLQKCFTTFTLKFGDLPFNIQLIEYSFFDWSEGGNEVQIYSVKDLISTFDFACIGFGVSLQLSGLLPATRHIDSVYIHPSFISSNASKILYPIRSCLNFRACSILRFEKYLKDYGFSLNPANLKYYSLLCDFNENEAS